jgi:hypothetical protein
MAIAEKYKDETFEVLMTDEKGFFVKLSKSGLWNVEYDDYKLEGNILTWVG